MKQEKDILKGLRGKQEEAQRLLLQRYGGMVFSQVVRIVLSQEDAEEVYQDAVSYKHMTLPANREEEISGVAAASTEKKRGREEGVERQSERTTCCIE